ncbi:hypothetical protein JKF63_02647 [Porcisia hertigi]|uniref:Uncharacterized protein n=1 Tax=Porcisia hertigi TaxID=2761500 RepID=A0A836IIZ4_9TRYP|nr:hypothetical protein JKF63_02647 [Porcisia hertigi]
MRAEEYGEGEVLTGAELYLYLLRQNEEQLRRAQEKLHQYSTLKETLHVLTERSRRRVLAPVAGGLAYYPAELNATNTILVLLGDGWFAERSAVQAAEIAGRRVDFLRREAEVLQQEQSALRAKQELFLSELPEAQNAMAELLAERETQVVTSQRLAQSSSTSQTPQQQSSAAGLSSGPSAPANAPDDSGAPDPGRASVSPLYASSGICAPPHPSSTLATSSEPPTASELPLDYSTIDAALATFDDLDELTEEELIALEAELCDRLDDDEYVERVMTERMIAKKERRVRAELDRRRTADSANDDNVRTTEGTGVSSSSPTSPQALVPAACNAPQSMDTASVALASAADSRGSSVGWRGALSYKTPGDIGEAAAASAAARPMASPSTPTDAFPAGQARASFLGASVSNSAPTSFLPTAALTRAQPLEGSASADGDTPAAAPQSASVARSSHRKERHVKFSLDVRETRELSSLDSADNAQSPQAAFSGEVNSFVEHSGAETVLQRTQSLPRSTYTIGDIVEHEEGIASGADGAANGVASGATIAPLFSGQRQKPKRKSLFMRELESERE